MSRLRVRYHAVLTVVLGSFMLLPVLRAQTQQSADSAPTANGQGSTAIAQSSVSVSESSSVPESAGLGLASGDLILNMMKAAGKVPAISTAVSGMVGQIPSYWSLGQAWPDPVKTETAGWGLGFGSTLLGLGAPEAMSGFGLPFSVAGFLYTAASSQKISGLTPEQQNAANRAGFNAGLRFGLGTVAPGADFLANAIGASVSSDTAPLNIGNDLSGNTTSLNVGPDVHFVDPNAPPGNFNALDPHGEYTHKEPGSAPILLNVPTPFNSPGPVDSGALNSSNGTVIESLLVSDSSPPANGITIETPQFVANPSPDGIEVSAPSAPISIDSNLEANGEDASGGRQSTYLSSGSHRGFSLDKFLSDLMPWLEFGAQVAQTIDNVQSQVRTQQPAAIRPKSNDPCANISHNTIVYAVGCTGKPATPTQKLSGGKTPPNQPPSQGPAPPTQNCSGGICCDPPSVPNPAAVACLNTPTPGCDHPNGPESWLPFCLSR